MIGKQQLLEDLRQALSTGMVSRDEVHALLGEPPQASSPSVAAKSPDSPSKLSAVEIMFYVSGLVLFIAIMVMIVQSWTGNGSLRHILLSVGVGSALWAVAYILHRQPVATDIRKGLVNALVLTGSLCLITGGFIVTNQLIGGFNEVNFIPGAVTFAVLGALHFAYQRLVRKDLLFLLAIFLSIAAFPSLLFGILQDAHLPTDVWSVVFISSTLMLPRAMRIAVKIDPSRANLRRAFDPLTAFLSLLTMFASSFGQYGVVWLVLLVGSVLGLFYLSIVLQNKNLLGNASFFLVVAVVEVSFRYFSGAGVSVSLIIAALGLLGSAAVATTLNKKYFKAAPAAVQPTEPAAQAAEPEVFPAHEPDATPVAHDTPQVTPPDDETHKPVSEP